MIDALIGGRLYGKAKERTARNGHRFVTAKVRTPAGDGDSIFVNVITFAESACPTLLALDDDDSVSLSGELTPKVWETREGAASPALDMMADAPLTTYHVRRKRRFVASHAAAGNSQQPPLDDPLP